MCTWNAKAVYIHTIYIHIQYFVWHCKCKEGVPSSSAVLIIYIKEYNFCFVLDFSFKTFTEFFLFDYFYVTEKLTTYNL